jgi:hypothetical protein
MKKLIGLSCFTMMLTLACASNNVVVNRIPFPEAEYANLHVTGTGVVRGQVCLVARGGDEMVAAGNRVTLNPVTSYSSQWYESAHLKQPLADPDPRINVYVREVDADAEGHFIFANIPEGEYFLSTPLVWEAPWPVRRESSVTLQGRFVAQKVSVQEGVEVTVPLTCRVRLPGDMLCIIRPDSTKMPYWTALSF